MRAKTRENAPKTPPVWLPVDYPILPSTPCLLPCSARCRIGGGWSTRHPATAVPVEVPVTSSWSRSAGRSTRARCWFLGGQFDLPKSRSIHAGAGNLSAYERTKLALGRRYNRTKKGVGGQIPGSRVDQIDPSVSTAANLAAEHSALRLVEVPAMPFEQIVRQSVPETRKPALPVTEDGLERVPHRLLTDRWSFAG